jgi:nicotinamidase/pyrazinamidase
MADETNVRPLAVSQGDALIIVDVQRDFLAGGALAVPKGDEVIGTLNRYLDLFSARGLPIFATRDWHPPNHCSFVAQGGPWPPHCIMHTAGAEFPPELRFPRSVKLVSKATGPQREALSPFSDTNLDEQLRSLGIRRLFVGGLATDYCVAATVRDALTRSYAVVLLTDAIRAVDVRPQDGGRAQDEMLGLGAMPARWEDLSLADRATSPPGVLE